MPPAKKDSPTADPQNARWRIDGAQKHLLEEVFNEKRFPDPELKKRLASQLDVDPRRIQVWFQNRRQREKPQDPMSPSYEAGGPKWKPMHEPGGLPPTHIPSAASLPLPGPSDSPISASPRKRARGSREGAPSNKPAPSRRGNGLDNGAGPSAAASGSGLHPMPPGASAGAGTVGTRLLTRTRRSVSVPSARGTTVRTAAGSLSGTRGQCSTITWRGWERARTLARRRNACWRWRLCRTRSRSIPW